MEMSKQAELVPSVLNAIEGKPLSHQDRFVCYMFFLPLHLESRINSI